MFEKCLRAVFREDERLRNVIAPPSLCLNPGLNLLAAIGTGDFPVSTL